MLLRGFKLKNAKKRAYREDFCGGTVPSLASQANSLPQTLRPMEYFYYCCLPTMVDVRAVTD